MVLWALVLLFACSNAVNFTDGIDGLAAGTMLIGVLAFMVIAYVSSHLLPLIISRFPMFWKTKKSPFSAPPLPVPVLVSSGLIPPRPRSLWAIPDLRVWVAPWPWSR